ncbi:hypothetical protein LAZ67_8000380 [Cordylochernes scorpioides]|uniref:Cytochrome P450 n=1 Tax=Cordylochernes scorpioides TaxID=51811 RepID=A0ABY6KUF8_9ARAC|nr:hypothetical protein LAZ67_8000380 [Cordylochernes scorpioides]
MERLPDNITEDTKLTYLQFLLVRSEFSRNDAITMATDMMLGGVDTILCGFDNHPKRNQKVKTAVQTSHSFSFLLFNLARNPQVQEKVYQELMGLLKHKDAPITPEILNEMRYLKACVKESMRISPIVDGTSRTLQQDVVMSGYLVPAGTNLLAHNMVACRQPSYFPEPNSFLPERWLDKSPQRVIPPNFTFLPFGFGPRMCVGRRIAEHEIWLLLAKIIMNFRVEYPYKEDIGMLFRLVNIPDRPLKFKFVDRD